MNKEKNQSQESTSMVSTIFDVCDQICGVLLKYGIEYKEAIDMTADIAKEIIDVLDIQGGE